MSGKNPFKIIEEENINRYKDIGPDVPPFIDTDISTSIKTITPSSGSPSFPSFS